MNKTNSYLWILHGLWCLTCVWGGYSICFYHIAGFSGEEWQPWRASAGPVRGQANLGQLYNPGRIDWDGCHRCHPRCHGDVDAHVLGTSPHANSSSRPSLILKISAWRRSKTMQRHIPTSRTAASQLDGQGWNLLNLSHWWTCAALHLTTVNSLVSPNADTSELWC